jgi:hypothetical protein
MLLMIALPHRAAPLTVRCSLPASDPRAAPEYSGWTRFRFAASGLRGTRGRDREGHLTACAAISFKHHKELFSETLPRNLP